MARLFCCRVMWRRVWLARRKASEAYVPDANPVSAILKSNVVWPKVQLHRIQSIFRTFVYIFRSFVYIFRTFVYSFKTFVFTLCAVKCNFMSDLLQLFARSHAVLRLMFMPRMCDGMSLGGLPLCMGGGWHFLRALIAGAFVCCGVG